MPHTPDDDGDVRLVAALPTPREYCDLRVACGLSPKDLEDTRAALPNSVYGVCLRSGSDALVGMGRLVGDGRCVLQVVDIAVHPTHQGRGLGHTIMSALMAFVEEHAPRAFVTLFADVDFLYEKYGFVVGRASRGMVLLRNAPKEPTT